MLVIPFMLLTAPLTSCANIRTNKDPFMISEDKFNEAVTFSGKGIKYVQKAQLMGVIGASVVASLTYNEDFISPTVYSHFNRRVDSTSSNPIYLDRCYVEHAGDNYWKYTQDSNKWVKNQCDEDDFKTPSCFGVEVSSILEYKKITYDSLRNSYDKDRQAYYFSTDKETRPYAIALAFYNDRLTYFSYEYFEESGTTQFGTMSYTYGLITPELPEVDPE